MEVGKTYKTRGGWDALVIWCHQMSDQQEYFSVIHKPREKEEFGVVKHFADGKIAELFKIGYAPDYGLHPADIIL